MNRYEVIFSPQADADLDSILHYIAADNPAAAIRFVDALRARAIDFLSVTPNGGTPLGKVRYIAFGNYVVVYSVSPTARRVRVLLVTEGHRAWRRLLKDRF
jgi:plasmid stabilization system protein ParE